MSLLPFTPTVCNEMLLTGASASVRGDDAQRPPRGERPGERDTSDQHEDERREVHVAVGSPDHPVRSAAFADDGAMAVPGRVVTWAGAVAGGLLLVAVGVVFAAAGLDDADKISSTPGTFTGLRSP